MEDLDTPAGRTVAAAGAVTQSHMEAGATAGGRKVVDAGAETHPPMAAVAKDADSTAVAAGVETFTQINDVEQEARSKAPVAGTAPHLQPPREAVEKEDGGEVPLPGEETQLQMEKRRHRRWQQGGRGSGGAGNPSERPGGRGYGGNTDTHGSGGNRGGK